MSFLLRWCRTPHAQARLSVWFLWLFAIALFTGFPNVTSAQLWTYVGVLENPRNGSSQSGIGMVTGWYCDTLGIEVQINDSPYTYYAAYGTERPDTEEVCGDTDNGFGFLLNWNELGDGEHKIVVFAGGEEFGRSTITVTTLGGETFPKGLEGEYTLDGFPDSESSVVIRWEESLQNFVIIEYLPAQN